jgi:septum formation protein
VTSAAKQPGPIILASGSPRRRQLLEQIGLTFTVAPAHVDERIVPGETPEEHVLRLARDKALAVIGHSANGIIIAADTIVVLHDAVLGKPADRSDAVRMLTLLSGNAHRVITGLYVIQPAKGRSEMRIAVTTVWFRRMRAEEIAAYADSGEPLDKAGAYGIQEKGALFVDHIDGCYFNVVGLPLALLGECLEVLGVPLW